MEEAAENPGILDKAGMTIRGMGGRTGERKGWETRTWGLLRTLAARAVGVAGRRWRQLRTQGRVDGPDRGRGGRQGVGGEEVLGI